MDMNSDRDSQTSGHADLAHTEARLRAARFEADPITLDRALSTARARARRSAPGGFLRSKIAIVAVLTSGLALSGTGVTLAFQGPSGSGNVSSAQYAPALPNSGEEQGQQQDNSLPQGQTETLSGNPRNGSKKGDNSPSANTQAQRQVAATGTGSGDRLPFTGLAAIPVIMLGLAMILAGVFMQRRTAPRRS